LPALRCELEDEREKDLLEIDVEALQIGERPGVPC
jgi:hypothetical protein